MACHIKDEKSKLNDMEELKYLICAIDSLKCPSEAPPQQSWTLILPPRIEEIPCEIPARRPPCAPSPRCYPITPGPCCSPRPLLPPKLLETVATLTQSSPSPRNLYCRHRNPYCVL